MMFPALQQWRPYLSWLGWQHGCRLTDFEWDVEGPMRTTSSLAVTIPSVFTGLSLHGIAMEISIYTFLRYPWSSDQNKQTNTLSSQECIYGCLTEQRLLALIVYSSSATMAAWLMYMLPRELGWYPRANSSHDHDFCQISRKVTCSWPIMTRSVCLPASTRMPSLSWLATLTGSIWYSKVSVLFFSSARARAVRLSSAVVSSSFLLQIVGIDNKRRWPGLGLSTFCIFSKPAGDRMKFRHSSSSENNDMGFRYDLPNISRGKENHGPISKRGWITQTWFQSLQFSVDSAARALLWRHRWGCLRGTGCVPASLWD